MIAIILMSFFSNEPPLAGEDGDEIRAVLERFEAAWNRGDVEAMAEVYTDPHVDVNHPEQVMSRKETREMLAALRPGYFHRIDITSDQVVVEGNRAYQRGSFVLTPTNVGAAAGRQTIAKRYLEILRREEDGTWRVWWSMDGSISPAEE